MGGSKEYKQWTAVILFIPSIALGALNFILWMIACCMCRLQTFYILRDMIKFVNGDYSSMPVFEVRVLLLDENDNPKPGGTLR